MRRRRLSFGPFRLDPIERRLWKGSELVSLAPKPLALLSYLAERPGRLATKTELLRAVWPGVHVGEAVLKTCIAEIRQALGDAVVSAVHRNRAATRVPLRRANSVQQRADQGDALYWPQARNG